MNLSVMPYSNASRSNKQPNFKSAYAEFNGVWKKVSEGGKLVSEAEALTNGHTMLELSGVGTKIADCLPLKAYLNAYFVKQKLVLNGKEAKEFRKLSKGKSPDLRLFLNKFFVGEELRFTDSKKMYINNLTPPKTAAKGKDIVIIPTYQLKYTG